MIRVTETFYMMKWKKRATLNKKKTCKLRKKNFQVYNYGVCKKCNKNHLFIKAIF